MHRFLLLSPLLIGLFASPAFSADASLFGASISKNDYVGARIVHVVGSAAIIDLGYARGVLKGNRFWVFRKFGVDFRRIGAFEVSSVRRKTAAGRALKNVRLRKGDTVVILAADLAIWHGRTEEEVANTNKLLAERAQQGYDRTDTQIDKDDLLEHRPQNVVRLRAWKKVLTTLKPVGSVYWDTSTLKIHRREFISTSTISGDLTGEAARMTYKQYNGVLGNIARFVKDPKSPLLEEQDLAGIDPDAAKDPVKASADAREKQGIPDANFIARKIAENLRGRRF